MESLSRVLVSASWLLLLVHTARAVSLKETLTITDLKDWKKVLKTKTNILALFATDEGAVSGLLPTLDRAAVQLKGEGTFVFVDCSQEGKKLCKSLRVKPDPFSLKHFKDGDFNKDYDRKLVDKSLIGFMRNPTAEPPWSEDSTASDVFHVEGPSDFEKLMRKEKRPVLLMFYAPWCGHCKQLKPEFAAAATELKGAAVLAAMDVDTPDAYGIRTEFNITGFPTIIYFENGQKRFPYAGGRDKQGIVDWMKKPEEAPPSPPQEEEQPWSETESDVVHLAEDTFDAFIGQNPSVLVMFYAPWCGHCKRMKPEYGDAARALKEEGVNGALAAVDATKNPKLAGKYEVKGYPTIKYFRDGVVRFEYGYGRDTQSIVDFMKDPKEPPPPEKDWSEIESDVEHLTDETFKATLKKKKHALVMFFAPWCGHCKAAKPEFTAAAGRLAEDKKVMFGSLDCTKHSALCQQHEVTGYPTFKYFNYGKNDFKYQGGRTAEDFVSFMSDPGSHTEEL